MKCSRCKATMISEGIEQLINDTLYQTFICPVCGYRKDIEVGKKNGFYFPK